MEQVDLAEQERVVLLGDPPPTSVDIEHAGLVEVVAVLDAFPVLDRPGLSQSSRSKGTRRVVGQVGVLDERVRDIDPESVDAPLKPEANDAVVRLGHLRIRPVEVGLFGQVEVQPPLTRVRVERPGWPAEGANPVVRRPAGRAAAPDVPVPLRVSPRRSGAPEPRMFVRGVVRDEIEQDANPESMRLLEKRVEGLEVAEPRVDPAVIRDVVAAVGERGDIERREPDEIDPEPRQVVEPL